MKKTIITNFDGVAEFTLNPKPKARNPRLRAPGGQVDRPPYRPKDGKSGPDSPWNPVESEVYFSQS